MGNIDNLCCGFGPGKCDDMGNHWVPLGKTLLLVWNGWLFYEMVCSQSMPSFFQDTLEMLTEGFGDAGEIRTGLHLGAAQPATARISSYKSILVAVICATLFTSLLWILGENLATWLTPDLTLQSLIIDVLPLMGIGNIALTSGSVSWALVGA